MLLEDLNGCEIDDLAESYRDRLDNSTIRTVRLSGWDSDSILYTIFHRLNTGSVQLNTQELRSALFPGPFTSFASSFTEENLEFASLFNRRAAAPDFRMRDVELLTRYCGITRRVTSYKGNLKLFLDDTTKWLNSIDNADMYLSYAKEALASIELCGRMYARISNNLNCDAIPAFTLLQAGRGYRFNRAVFDALCYPLQDSAVRDEVSKRIDRIAEQGQNLLSSDEFISVCSSSTKTPKSLVSRVDMWSSLLADELHMQVMSLKYSGGEAIECSI